MKQSQNEKILEHLQEFGTITPLEAIEYGCMRLASRVADLKRRGYVISSEMGKSKNRNGETVRFAVYRLIGEVPVD